MPDCLNSAADPIWTEALLEPVDRLPVLSVPVLRLLRLEQEEESFQIQLRVMTGPPLLAEQTQEPAVDLQRAVLLYRVKHLAQTSLSWAPAGLWRRAVLLAEVSRLQAQRAGRIGGLAWRCGLLRGAAEMLSEHLFPRMFEKVCMQAERAGERRETGLSLFLGTDPVLLCGSLLRRWGLNREADVIEASGLPPARQSIGTNDSASGLLAQRYREWEESGGQPQGEIWDAARAEWSQWEQSIGLRLESDAAFGEACSQQERRVLGLCEENPVVYRPGRLTAVLQKAIEKMNRIQPAAVRQVAMRWPGSSRFWIWSWPAGGVQPVIRSGSMRPPRCRQKWPVQSAEVWTGPGGEADPEEQKIITAHAPLLEAMLKILEVEARRSFEAMRWRAGLSEAEGRVQNYCQEAMEQVSAAAAHDLNNPLQVISGRAQILLRQLPEDSAEHQAAVRIEEQARRLSRLVHDWHLSSRRPEVAAQAVGIPDLMQRAVRAASERLGRDLACRQAELPEPAVWHTDADLLEQVLVELLVNAAEAGGEAIELAMGASVDRLKRRCILWVADRSGGMDEQTARMAFEPFISRKPAGKQSGLGLARVRSGMLALGGEVRLVSQPGVGTRLVLSLPWEEKTSGTLAHAALQPELSDTTGTPGDRSA